MKNIFILKGKDIKGKDIKEIFINYLYNDISNSLSVVIISIYLLIILYKTKILSILYLSFNPKL